MVAIIFVMKEQERSSVKNEVIGECFRKYRKFSGSFFSAVWKWGLTVEAKMIPR